MTFFRTAKAAMTALKANGLRSILMALGVVIGAATIVAVVAIGLGARESIDEQYSNMSVTTIFVNQVQNNATELSADDAQVIAALPEIAAVAPQLTGRVAIVMDETTSQTMVVGTTPAYQTIAALDFAAGSFFTPEDLERRERVVVLGPTERTLLDENDYATVSVGMPVEILVDALEGTVTALAQVGQADANGIVSYALSFLPELLQRIPDESLVRHDEMTGFLRYSARGTRSPRVPGCSKQALA